MANPALLTIGTSASRIDLLNPHGFMLSEWRPQAGDHDGVFAESALADGRQLAAARDLNVIETYELKMRASSTDMAAQRVQELRRLLRSARNYWTSGDPSLVPVYLEARTSCETNSRYALVYDARLPEDDGYYRQPFLQGNGDRVMDELALIIERGPWLENAPGTGTCVQASGTQAWSGGGQNVITAAPAASTDDVWHIPGNVSINLTSTAIPFGYNAEDSCDGGIRFTNVTVPVGATIIKAYVTFVATSNLGADDCLVMIDGQAADDPATFSDYYEYIKRVHTTAKVPWDIIDNWTAASTYNTPSLIPIIQEIVDRAGWASGNDLVLFFMDNGSTAGAYRSGASWDNVTYTAPTLTIVYTATEGTYGRAATCLNEVYISNKHNIAQLTHIYYYDDSGAAFSANLLGTATPFEFLPNPVADNDCVYFGIQSSLEDSGPFSSLVFDIGTAAVYTGEASMTWEYYSTAGGGTWVALAVQDNTGNLQAFSVEGVNSVHWVQPSTWTTVAINGVTAYWVRAIASIGADPQAITTPTQQNRDVYTIDWPCIEIDEAQVGGDMPALARVKLQNQSDAPLSNDPVLYSSRIIAGLRNQDRGEDFTAYINLSDEQNPAGINVIAANETTIVSLVTAPTGRACYFDSSGGAGSTQMQSRVFISIENTIAYQYYGKYRAFIRGLQVAGGTLGNVLVRLYAFSGGSTYLSRSIPFTALNTWQALDMGLLTLPSGAYGTDEIMDDPIRLNVQASSAAAADDAYFTDIILIPEDEWSGEFIWNGSTISGRNGYLSYDQTLLDIDSISYPKNYLRTSTRKAINDGILSTWESRCGGAIVLLNNLDQRLWTLSMRNLTGSTIWYADPEIAHSIQIYRQQRYDTLRGAR